MTNLEKIDIYRAAYDTYLERWSHEFGRMNFQKDTKGEANPLTAERERIAWERLEAITAEVKRLEDAQSREDERETPFDSVIDSLVNLRDVTMEHRFDVLVAAGSFGDAMDALQEMQTVVHNAICDLIRLRNM